MKLLAIDTATSTAGIALVDDDRVLGQARHDTSARGADLLVAIDRVCADAGVAPRALDAVAIGAGPGSFTGLRIGMATAKGIAFAAGRPLWAVSSLAALADDARRDAHDGVICAVLDARRGEVFAGCFSGGAPLGDERVLAPDDLVAWVAGLAGDAPVRYAGDAIVPYGERFAGLAWAPARTPSGVAVARLALAGARVDITRAGAPTYIRPSEAEVMYPDGVPGALRKR
ncbi:MAG TPA: tRNA (adenosine(37)-N6)-threonylcarbamoyltransferase complex dimerization subunit type 1 TsaB [Kofleriaceae bacterium]|nr:tRNA (adenosine(37)-N6)-threonylcarbamoyltransferase complex dimerization subunit type 1 TsaB [Kofleriaceae bacterium]